HDLMQNLLALLQRQGSQIITIDVKQIEQVDIRGICTLPGLHLGRVLQVKTLLQRAKAGSIVLVETDDFPIHQGRSVQAFSQGLCNVRKLEVLRQLVATQEHELLPIEAAKHS